MSLTNGKSQNLEVQHFLLIPPSSWNYSVYAFYNNHISYVCMVMSLYNIYVYIAAFGVVTEFVHW